MSSSKRLSRKQKRKAAADQNHIVNTKFTMDKLSPLTETQSKLFEAFAADKNISNIGSAGTGKTYASLYLSLQDVLEKKQYNRILIIRSAVQGRDQGFMPGNPTEKLAHYESPYIDITNDLFGRSDAYSILKQQGLISFTSTSFIRGLTWDNTIVLVDETQNMNWGELYTICTRIGQNSKIVLCGDMRQDDLLSVGKNRDKSGLEKLSRIVKLLPNFEEIVFTRDDIVRSGFVKDFIIAEETI